MPCSPSLQYWTGETTQEGGVANRVDYGEVTVGGLQEGKSTWGDLKIK